MGGTIDKAKGRIKEAVGSLTNNPKLKREGRRDQTAGAVKETTEKIVDRTKKALEE